MNVDTAYATCTAITRHEARNFSYGIRLLPPRQRRAMSATYALARRIDDIGDSSLPAGDRLELLAQVQERLHDLGRPRGDPVLVAIADASHRFPMPMDAFDELIDGCRADVHGQSYRTFDELVGYCRLVAGTIGRLSVAIYEPAQLARASELGERLGVALQLTNILRDVREDRLAGRVYLPVEDLDRFGCPLTLAAGRIADPSGPFAELIRFQADRAEHWYEQGLDLLDLLDWRSAACTAAMAGIYRRLLGSIRVDPDRVRSSRLSVTTGVKLAVAARAVAGRAA